MPPKHSIAVLVVVFFFWFVFVVREGFALIGDAWGISPSQATAITGAVTAFFAITTTFAALFRGRRISIRNLFQGVAPLKWVALLLLWSTISLFWTEASSKTVALGYLCLLIAVCVTVIAQVKIMEATELLNCAETGFIFGAVALVLIAIATYAGSGRLGDPDLLHPNTLGKETAIATLIALHRIRLTSSGAAKICWALAGIGLLSALAATVSKTSLGAFVIACLIYFLAGKHSMRAKAASVVLVVLVAAAGFALLSPQLENYSRQQHGAALETVSGRLPLWQDTIEMIRERPVTGYGFLSFRDYGPQLFNVRVVHAHNEWLHIWFSLGLIGVFLAAGVYVTYFRTARRLRRSSVSSRHAELALALLAMGLVRGVTEADLTGLVFSLPLLLVMIAPAAVSSFRQRAVAVQVARPEWARTQVLARNSQ
jgi:O-antigen ligase